MDFNTKIDKQFFNKDILFIRGHLIGQTKKYVQTMSYPNGTSSILFDDATTIDAGLFGEDFIINIEETQNMSALEENEHIVNPYTGLIDNTFTTISDTEHGRLLKEMEPELLEMNTSIPQNGMNYNMQQQASSVNSSPTIEFLKKAKKETIEINIKFTLEITKKAVIKMVLDNFPDSEEDVKEYFLSVIKAGDVKRQMQESLFKKYLDSTNNE